MDDTSIANQALQAIGTRSQITSLTELSPEAAAVNLVYATTRDSLLRLCHWDFARWQKPLSVWKAAKGTPENLLGASAVAPSPWLYSYLYPVDCAKFRYLLPIIPADTATINGVPLTSAGTVMPYVQVARRPIKCRVAGDQDANGNALRVILTNQQGAIAVYTGLVTDPNVWDEQFRVAMIGRLAAQLVNPLSGDKGLASMAIKLGTQAEIEAKVTNGNEGEFDTDRQAEWIAAQGFPENDSEVLSDFD